MCSLADLSTVVGEAKDQFQFVLSDIVVSQCQTALPDIALWLYQVQ